MYSLTFRVHVMLR